MSQTLNSKIHCTLSANQKRDSELYNNQANTVHRSTALTMTLILTEIYHSSNIKDNYI